MLLQVNAFVDLGLSSLYQRKRVPVLPIEGAKNASCLLFCCAFRGKIWLEFRMFVTQIILCNGELGLQVAYRALAITYVRLDLVNFPFQSLNFVPQIIYSFLKVVYRLLKAARFLVAVVYLSFVFIDFPFKIDNLSLALADPAVFSLNALLVPFFSLLFAIYQVL